MSESSRAEDARGAPRVHLVFPALPPRLDGIGDHTARLAEALAHHVPTAILTAEAHPEAVPGVAVRRAFSEGGPAGLGGLPGAVAADVPDWLVLQYNPFSYGRWGWNPRLPRLVRRLKAEHPALRLAVVVHEVAPPLLNWRLGLMTTWQLAQLWSLGRAADVVFAAIEPWVAPFGRWFGSTPVVHLPVGSNVPFRAVDRAEARQALDLPDPAFVVGVFGTAHPTRLLGHVRAAVEALRTAGADARVLYVGPDGGAVRARLGGLPVVDSGRVPAADVSNYFAAMDLYLAPFRGGVSSRRGSFVAALQHGLPAVSTVGRQTGAALRAADGTAFVLTPAADAEAFGRAAVGLFREPERRAALGRAGQALFAQAFDWDVLAARLLNTLASIAPRRRA